MFYFFLLKFNIGIFNEKKEIKITNELKLPYGDFYYKDNDLG